MSLPRYSNYKDSGVPWIGEVPEHWLVLRIKTFTEFCGGGTPSRDNLAYWNGDIPWISPKDMKSERIAAAEECLTSEGLLNSSSSMVDAGRLLVVVRSGILKHTIPVAINEVPVALNQDMKALVFSEKLATSDFILRWIQGLNDALLLAWGKQGATVESIEHAYLANTPVPLPTLDEQRAIATFLARETAKIDALITEQEKLLALLAEKRQATISHAVTRGLNAHSSLRDSGVPWLGELPAHWHVRRVKWLIESIEQGWSPQCESYPVESADEWGVLKVGCVNGGAFDATENKRLPDGVEPIRAYALKKDDLLISRANTRELVGSAAVVREDHSNLFLCDKLYRVRTDTGICLPWFLAAFLGTPLARSRIEVEATGASSSMLNIGQSTILELDVPLPPLEEQLLIRRIVADELVQLDELVAEAKKAIHLLTERRRSLILAAVAGQIDARLAAGARISKAYE